MASWCTCCRTVTAKKRRACLHSPSKQGSPRSTITSPPRMCVLLSFSFPRSGAVLQWVSHPPARLPSLPFSRSSAFWTSPTSKLRLWRFFPKRNLGTRFKSRSRRRKRHGSGSLASTQTGMADRKRTTSSGASFSLTACLRWILSPSHIPLVSVRICACVCVPLCMLGR